MELALPLCATSHNCSLKKFRQTVTFARAVESLPICIEDIRSKWMRKEKHVLQKSSLVKLFVISPIDHFVTTTLQTVTRKLLQP